VNPQLPLHPIPEDKRVAVLAAAVREFAALGYASASTNHIVEAAHISKGLLFYYFGDKKGLYLYAVQTSIGELTRRFDERLGAAASPDVFERLKQYTLAKWSLVEEQPAVFEFLQEAVLDPPAELRDALAECTAEPTAMAYQRLFQGIDTAAFRPGVTVEQAMCLLSWTFDGLGKQYAGLLRQRPLDLDGIQALITAEIDTYVALLRHGIETGPG
jgi:AcrR family transcriptional regulator